MSFYTILLHVHSVLRYVVLVLLFFAIVDSLRGVINKRHYLGSNQKINLITMAAFHVQVLFGILMYFLSPKVQLRKEMFHDEMLRFFTMEHISLMIIAMAIITIGYMKAKKNIENGHKLILFYYTLTLVLVLCAIPWPFRVHLLGEWF